MVPPPPSILEYNARMSRHRKSIFDNAAPTQDCVISGRGRGRRNIYIISETPHSNSVYNEDIITKIREVTS